MTGNMGNQETPDFEAFQFETDLATLAVFDPSALTSRVRAPQDWWRGDPTALREFDEGKILVLPIGRDGEYRVRLAFNELREEERPYLRKSLQNLVLDIPEGRVFVGPGERVPGGGLGDRYPRIAGQGELFEVPAGQYAAAVHVFDWRVDPRWFDHDGEPKPEAPADFVILLEPFSEPSDMFFAGLPEILPSLLSLRARPKIEVKPPSSPVFIGARTGAAKRQKRGGQRATNDVSAAKEPINPEYFTLLAQLEELPELQKNLLAPGMAFEDADQFHVQPQNTLLKAHTWSAGEMQKKCTRVREFLRVLEQKVNRSKIEALEKAEFQIAITHVYESLQDLFVTPKPVTAAEQNHPAKNSPLESFN